MVALFALTACADLSGEDDGLSHTFGIRQDNDLSDHHSIAANQSPYGSNEQFPNFRAAGAIYFDGEPSASGILIAPNIALYAYDVWRVVGISSHGALDTESDYGDVAVFTQVAPHAEWIESVAAGEWD